MSAVMTGRRLEALTLAIAARFPADKLSPGVVIAAIPNASQTSRKFYASARRYQEDSGLTAFGSAMKGGLILCQAWGGTPALAIAELAKKFHRLYAPEPEKSIKAAFESLKGVL
jgi:hypothetical protein